jgi:hypothetical protein
MKQIIKLNFFDFAIDIGIAESKPCLMKAICEMNSDKLPASLHTAG